MQLIWYLPSLVIGLVMGFTSGYWQLGLASVLMFGLMALTQLYRNRYPQFEKDSVIDVSNGQVAIANSVLPRFELFWKKDWQQLLLTHFRNRAAPDFLKNLLTENEFGDGWRLKADGQVPIWLGATSSSELQIDLVKAGPHCIIVGPTGSGKSELMRLICASLISSNQTDLVLFDFKGGATLEEFATHASGLATDLTPLEAQRLWQQLADELSSREQIFAQLGVSNFDHYQNSGGNLKAVVVVIDEFTAALATGDLVTRTVEDICARGRSLGVFLIAATQSLSGVARSMLTNLRCRIVMESADPIDLVQLGINPNQPKLPRVPGFAGAVISSISIGTQGFYFPLGFRPGLKPRNLPEVSEPAPPARSQLLRQMYSSQEQVKDPPEEPSSSPDSQLLLRMEALRL